MSMIKIASLTALAFTALANAAHAGPSVYYPISMCQGTDQHGRIAANDVRFRYGVAENYHDSENRYMVCPVPFDPAQTGKVIVRVVGFDNNNGTDGRLRAVLCESLLNTTNNCAPPSQSSDAFMGYSSLEVSYSVDNDTRFLYLNYEIPDVDSQSGRSYAFGYRVCRGSC